MTYSEPRRLIPAVEQAVAAIAVHDADVAAPLTASAFRMADDSSNGLTTGIAIASVPLALAALASDAYGQGKALPGIVVDVLNFALTLEFLEAEFYTRGLGTSGLIPADMREVFDQIRKHEDAHVALLQRVLGGRAVSKPGFDFTAGGTFSDVFSNAQTFAALAQAFEDTGVRAYKGQAANLMGQKMILRTALQIHSVEARHACQVRRMRQQKGWIEGSSRGTLPAAAEGVYKGEGNRFQFILAQSSDKISWTSAFDETLTKSQVLGIVAPFLAGGR